MLTRTETQFSKPPRLIAYTEEGGHWYQRQDDGGTYILTKEEMREYEHSMINPELQMPSYDPIWCYNWLQLRLKVEEENKAKNYLNSLIPEQLEGIRQMESLYLEIKPLVEEVENLSPLEFEIWKQNNPNDAEKVSKCLAWKHFGVITL